MNFSGSDDTFLSANINPFKPVTWPQHVVDKTHTWVPEQLCQKLQITLQISDNVFDSAARMLCKGDFYNRA